MKMKIKVEIVETLSRTIEVDAEDEDSAYYTVKQQYQDGEIVLDSGDFLAVDFDLR